jgi:hypothetical protein
MDGKKKALAGLEVKIRRHVTGFPANLKGRIEALQRRIAELEKI